MIEPGQRFTRLTALARIKTPGRASWSCRCDCGALRIVREVYLVSGAQKSCGCLRRELARNRAIARNGHPPARNPNWLFDAEDE